MLAQIQAVLTNLFQREHRMILDIYGSRAQDHRGHLGILEALGGRAGSLARERMHGQLEGVREALVRWDPEETPIS